MCVCLCYNALKPRCEGAFASSALLMHLFTPNLLALVFLLSDKESGSTVRLCPFFTHFFFFSLSISFCPSLSFFLSHKHIYIVFPRFNIVFACVAEESHVLQRFLFPKRSSAVGKLAKKKKNRKKKSVTIFIFKPHKRTSQISTFSLQPPHAAPLHLCGVSSAAAAAASVWFYSPF